MKQLLFAALLLSGSQAYSETVFVTLEKDNALAVVDPIAGKLLKTVPVGQRPRGIAISNDHRHLYIATSDDDTIQVIDTETLKAVGELPSGEDPETFALSPDGNFLYVANEDDALVTAIDVKAAKAIKTIGVGIEPEPVATSPDGVWVANASEATNMIHWIDSKTLEVVDNSLIDPRPRGLHFTADSQQLWATSELGGTLTIFDVNQHSVIKKISFKVKGVNDDKVQPVGVVVDKERKWGFVALGPSNRVALVDAQTLEVEKYFLVGQRVWNLSFSPDGKRLYTSNGISNDISIIDLESMKVTKSVAVGRYPWGIAVKP